MDRASSTNKGRGRRIAWLVVVVLAALFALRFWQLSGKESYASIGSIQQAEGKPVEVSVAARGNIESWTTLAGTVEGSFQYPVVSTNSIAVVGVAKREGDRVRPGDVIVRLEKSSPNPMLHSYPRSLAVYQDALADAERMRKLYREGAISQQMLDKAELSLQVARSDLANARESTDLVATHAGIVTSVLVKEGEMAPAYSPLAWIARTDSVRVSFEAGSRQATAIGKGQRVVWRSTMNGDSGTGVISRLDLSADPESHLVRGEALFPNVGGKLIPGILLSFEVLAGERRAVVKIPTGCLMEAQGAWNVIAVEEGEGGKLIGRFRKVEIGLTTTDEAEIKAGVNEGDRIVRFGQTTLDDGDLVKIVRGGEAK